MEIEQICKVIQWSLLALWAGQHPLHNHQGLVLALVPSSSRLHLSHCPLSRWLSKAWAEGSEGARLAGLPLAEGKRGCIFKLAGDMEMFANTLHLGV